MLNPALNLVPAAVGQGRPQIIPAVVAPNTSRTPLPTSFTDPLFVVNPADDTVFWEIADWTVDHGGTLPEAGAAAALFYDSAGALRCVWWDGVYTAPDPPAGTLLELAVTGTGRKIAFGTVSVAFAASPSSSTATITHGLGTTPAVVLATMRGLGPGVAVYPVTGSVGATTFQVQGEATAAITATVTIDWLAIG